MRDENGDEIKGLSHVERDVHFAGGPGGGRRDLSVAFIEQPRHLDLCRVMVGPTQATSRDGDLCAVLTLEQAQRVGVAILRAVDKASGVDWESARVREAKAKLDAQIYVGAKLGQDVIRERERAEKAECELARCRDALALIAETSRRHPGTVALGRCIDEVAQGLITPQGGQ